MAGLLQEFAGPKGLPIAQAAICNEMDLCL